MTVSPFYTLTCSQCISDTLGVSGAAVFYVIAVVEGGGERKETLHHMATTSDERCAQASSLREPPLKIFTCTVHVYVCVMGETECLPSICFFSPKGSLQLLK